MGKGAPNFGSGNSQIQMHQESSKGKDSRKPSLVSFRGIDCRILAEQYRQFRAWSDSNGWSTATPNEFVEEGR